jgi:heat shock protein HtpX
MELCLDNPREGFADLFATHPSVESRVDALVKYAGGHYEGPLALPMHPSDDNEDQANQPPPVPPPTGPWNDADNRPPQGTPAPLPGPWGNHPRGTGGPWGQH